jgi:hypothetical protein
MEYEASATERAIPAGELDRTHIGQTVSFQVADADVVFGRIGAIVRREGQIYISLQGVASGPHVPSFFPVAPDQNVYLPKDLVSNAEASMRDAWVKLSETFKDRVHKPGGE